MHAIDFHVHLPTEGWLEDSMGPYRQATEAYFRAKVDLKTVEQMAEEYRALDLMGVVLAWDAETFTGRPPVTNDLVSDIQSRFPELFIGFASVDPHKADAVDSLTKAVEELGLKGGKFHPSLQGFDPSDETFFPLWAEAERLGIPCIFHTGTSGVGAGAPGGQGIRIDLSRPILLDPLAAAFPDLPIVMAHFGWPWHLEAIAMALHKSNIYIDISGWSPRYIPPEVVAELKGRLADRFLWGSDYPFIHPSRSLDELDLLGLDEKVTAGLLRDNARRLLALE